MNILYNRKSYPEARMIINKTHNAYIFFSRKIDFYYLINRVFIKLIDKHAAYNIIQGLYNPVFLPKNADVIHCLNSVCITKKKWLVSCEWDFSCIHPDYPGEKRNKLAKKYMKYALKDNCLAILPFSYAARDHILQQARLCLTTEEYFCLFSKMKVIYPPQKIIATTAKTKYKDVNKWRFIFVGRQFFRKGGGSIIQAFKRLNECGYNNFELIVISSLESDGKAYDYNKTEVTDYMREESFIYWYESLDNQTVLDLIKNCHIGLLPTFSDTFGFSALEMQACGIPVISTNINALKEINDDTTGWLIDIEKDYYRVNYDNVSDCKFITNKIADDLYKILTGILCDENNSNILASKSQMCTLRIRNNHSEELYGYQLEEIYNL